MKGAQAAPKFVKSAKGRITKGKGKRKASSEPANSDKCPNCSEEDFASTYDTGFCRCDEEEEDHDELLRLYYQKCKALRRERKSAEKEFAFKLNEICSPYEMVVHECDHELLRQCKGPVFNFMTDDVVAKMLFALDEEGVLDEKRRRVFYPGTAQYKATLLLDFVIVFGTKVSMTVTYPAHTMLAQT